MVSKNNVIILIIVLIIFLIGCYGYAELFNQKEQITIGKINFTLPNGFHEGVPNNLGDRNLTNGTHTFFIAHYNNSNISYYMNQYKDYVKQNNYTITNGEFDVGNIHVYKTVNNQRKSEHYWFIKDDEVYSIYNWWHYDNFDKIIIDLIESVN